MSYRRLRFAPGIGGVLAFTILLSGCAVDPDPDDASSSSAQEQIETVEVGTVTPVITLQATVRAQTSYHIVAEGAGTFQDDGADGWEIDLDEEGEQRIVPGDLNATLTPLLDNGSRVTPNLPVIQADYRGFALVAQLDSADLLKFVDAPKSAKAQITEGSGPFECGLLDPHTTATPDGETPATIACAIPKDVPVLDGMTGLMAVQYETVKDALVLPVEAVAGTVGHGLVTVLIGEGDQAEEREVQLGPSDGVRIVIKSGLEAGDRVRLPSPSLTAE